MFPLSLPNSFTKSQSANQGHPGSVREAKSVEVDLTRGEQQALMQLAGKEGIVEGVRGGGRGGNGVGWKKTLIDGGGKEMVGEKWRRSKRGV